MKMKRALAPLLLIGLVAVLTGCTSPPAACTGNPQTSTGATQVAAQNAPAGTVVCLADGSYAKLTVNRSASGSVTVQSASPGGASLNGALVQGRGGVSIARFHMLGTFEAGVGSRGAQAFQNFFDMNNYTGYGVMACASSSTTCDDVSVIGNRFIGEAEEDQIRANRYHSTDGGKTAGLAVLGNEFVGNVEKGSHNDVFQSVWVGDNLVFSYDYLHDFGGQGFFVKDQASPINGLKAENNLIVNQDSPCKPSTLCSGFQLSPFQLFGPVANATIAHNTVGWGRGGGTAVLTGSWTNSTFKDNVFRILAVTNSGGTGTNFTGSNNTVCQSNSWPVPQGTQTGVCSPPFQNPTANDYRLPDGRGVTWTPTQDHYGP